MVEVVAGFRLFDSQANNHEIEFLPKIMLWDIFKSKLTLATYSQKSCKIQFRIKEDLLIICTKF